MSVAIDDIEVMDSTPTHEGCSDKRKGLARMCVLSLTAVSNRIERLKSTGVIIGLYYRSSALGFALAASTESEIFKIEDEKNVL